MKHSLLLLTSVWAGGCADPPSAPDPCEQDVLDCRAPNGFEIDPDCVSDEQLLVAVGQGADSFEPLEVPVVHHGSQGGRHLFVAVRVENPDLEHATFQTFIQLEGGGGDAGPATLAERGVVFSEDDATAQSGGRLELAGLILVLPDLSLSGPGRLVLDARDTCDRRGRATASFDWP